MISFVTYLLEELEADTCMLGYIDAVQKVIKKVQAIRTVDTAVLALTTFNNIDTGELYIALCS